MQIVPSGFDNWSAVIVAGVLVNVLFYSSLVFLCSEAIALAARQPNLPPYPKLLRLTGCVALPGTLLLVVGSVYQQTYLTWKHGPREVWFAGAQLAGHGSILLAWLFVFVLLAHLGGDSPFLDRFSSRLRLRSSPERLAAGRSLLCLLGASLYSLQLLEIRAGEDGWTGRSRPPATRVCCRSRRAAYCESASCA
jgi:hypothetical protein